MKIKYSLTAVKLLAIIIQLHIDVPVIMAGIIIGRGNQGVFYRENQGEQVTTLMEEV